MHAARRGLALCLLHLQHSAPVRMMLLTSSRTVRRRLVAVALTLSLILPTPASVSRADDELLPPLPPMTNTPVPTATATPAPTNTPTPQPTATATPSESPASEDPARPSVGLPPPPARPAPAALKACQAPPSVQPTSWELAGNTGVNEMRTAVEATYKAVEAREPGLTGRIVGFRPGTLYAHIY